MDKTADSYNIYSMHLAQNPANSVALSPLSFIQRAASVYPNKTALIHGAHRYTWAETYQRTRRLASALAKRGIKTGDTVSVLSPNTPAIYEASFGVPMVGAVLNTINTRLDPATVAFILNHAQARVLITDTALCATVREALNTVQRRPLVVDFNDDQEDNGELIGDITYEALLAEGDADFEWSLPQDEWQAIS